jgi:CRISPR-associated protein Cas1
MRNLHELPPFGDKLSYLYLEHAVIDKKDKAIAAHTADGATLVPVASLGLLLLGPGTRVTHAAMRSLADNNCLAAWCGEQGVRLYGVGLGGSRHSRNLIRQARLVSSELTRLQVVIRMYRLRFDGEDIDDALTLQQLRGREGIRVRQAYADASKRTGVAWTGRSYKREQWKHADPVNRALSAANACLYGIVHAAILSAGYSAALGFIHTGKQLSFVYDIADLYKAELSIPVAFEAASEGPEDIERRVRYRLRDTFRETRLIERILPDIASVLDVAADPATPEADEYADDAARPSDWWTPESIGDDVPIGDILRRKAK